MTVGEVAGRVRRRQADRAYEGALVVFPDELALLLCEAGWMGPFPAVVRPACEPDRGLLSRRQAAGVLSISEPTLDRLVGAGELIPLRVGRRVLFRVSDIESFIEAHVSRPEAAA